MRIFSIFLVCLAISSAQAAQKNDIPIIDMHVHYSEDAWASYSPADIAGLLENATVPRSLVSSSPDDGTLMLFRHDPKRFVPEIRPYRGQVNSSNWYDDHETPAYIEDRLNSRPYAGIGEFHLHNLDNASTATVRAIAKLARERNILLHVHSGAEMVQALFDQEPSLRILWAHAGMTTPPANVAAMLAKHPKLWADLSFREYDIIAGKELTGDWRSVLLRFPDRFVIGSDTYITSRWSEYGSIIADHRRWLKLLPDDVAKMIAYQNAVKLLGDGGIAALKR